MSNSSENDLQKAIDDITRTSGGQGAGVANAPGAEVPVNVTASGVENNVVDTASYVETNSQVPTEPVIPAVDLGVAPSTSATTEVDEKPKKDDFGDMNAEAVREKAIEDLRPMIGTVDLVPILSKIDLLPETKFKIYKSIIETTKDKAVLGAAYVTAKDIAGDAARAEALLYLVEMVDKLN